MKKLNDLPKSLNINNNYYMLKGVIYFKSPDRNNLRVSSGHYTAYVLRANGAWEHFDDTKNKIFVVSENRMVNVELLVYTK